MCGIMGVTASRQALDHADLSLMRDTMTHRGPDDAGLWFSKDGQTGLAHRRLAIVDLSPGGHQPLQDSDGHCHITFNGEIYNYRELRDRLRGIGYQFRSESDTEVLLAAYQAWGVDCVDALNGMFAFAIYDELHETLFLARDRAGEKPLFYRHAQGMFWFSSELKALLAHPEFPRRLDPRALDFYLAFGYVPGDQCMLAGVRKLPPGHALTYDLRHNRLKAWRYWELPQFDPRHSTSEHELVDELERLLLASVRRQMVADVPVGILLSGGLDSSLVTALAARSSTSPVRTFTIAFPGAGNFDETPHARLVASHFGTQHHELAVEPGSLDLLPRLAEQFDEPMADSSMIPTFLVAQLIRSHATVALGGDGGDELFGGYHHYSRLQRLERYRRYLPQWLRRTCYDLASRRLPVGLRGRNFLLELLSDVDDSIAQCNIYFDRAARAQLLRPLYGDWLDERASCEAYKSAVARPSRTPLQKATRVDFLTYLADDILVKVDRASMLASLEVRAPFLDQHLIEFAFGRVPDGLKATGRQRKILPRRLAARLLPKGLDLTRKQGFSVPLHTWFRGDWGPAMHEILRSAPSDLFDRRSIETMLARQSQGYTNIHRIFALTVFELWRRRYQISL